MMEIFFLLMASMVMTMGMAVVLVEKRFEWPIRNFSILFRRFLQQYTHRKMHRMPKCVVCLGFWCAIFSDFALLILSGGHYWLWPLSGFAASGALYLLYEVMNHFMPVVVETPSTDGFKADVDPQDLDELFDALNKSDAEEVKEKESASASILPGEMEGADDEFHKIIEKIRDQADPLDVKPYEGKLPERGNETTPDKKCDDNGWYSLVKPENPPSK